MTVQKSPIEIELNKTYVLSGKEFSMRRRIIPLAIGERFVFCRVIYPKCFGLKNDETVLSFKVMEQYEKE